MDAERLKETTEFLLKYIAKLPKWVRERIEEDLKQIEELIMKSRPPKIRILGRRGAGKSSLINAIFKKRVAAVGSVVSETGTPVWHKYESERGSVEILDTRGLGDKTKPESANFEDAFDEIKAVIKLEYPDIILFLCKAKEVDARISEDIENVLRIRKDVTATHNYETPILCAVTQVDELDPKRVEPPYENEKKKENIEASVEAITNVFNEKGVEPLETIPVSAYAEYEDEKVIYDNYWNIDSLVEFLLEGLPENAQVELARIAQIAAVQKKIARKIIAATASACAGIAATPIPVADIAPITALQITMIIGIGYISGRKMSKKTAAEFMTAAGVNVGAGFVLRQAARALVKTFFPGVGNAISAGVAFTGTWVIGETAIAYFVENKSMGEAKKKGKDAGEEHEKDDK